MPVTVNAQNGATPARRISSRGAPIHDSLCVGMMLGQAVSSSAPDTRCGRRASYAASTVPGAASGRPQCTKTVTGEDQRERHISSRLLSINSGEFRSIGGGAMELFDE